MGSRQYSTSIDIWSAGCILAEMATGRPLFPGSSTKDQLQKIFRTLGCPDLASWPGMAELPEYKVELFQMPYPPPPTLESIVPTLDAVGVDLLKMMIEYVPEKRISAERALQRKFFR